MMKNRGKKSIIDAKTAIQNISFVDLVVFQKPDEEPRLDGRLHDLHVHDPVIIAALIFVFLESSFWISFFISLSVEHF